MIGKIRFCAGILSLFSVVVFPGFNTHASGYSFSLGSGNSAIPAGGDTGSFSGWSDASSAISAYEPAVETVAERFSYVPYVLGGLFDVSEPVDLSGSSPEQMCTFGSGISYISGGRLSSFMEENGPVYLNEQMGRFIGDAFDDNQVVCLGEYHIYGAEQQFVSDLVPDLAAAGVEYLVLEIRDHYQGAVDDYLRTGEMTPELECALEGFQQEYLNILNAAGEYPGLKVVAVDPRPEGEDAEGFSLPYHGNIEIAQSIKDNILASDPDARIFIYYGAGHLEKNDPYSIPSQLQDSVDNVYSIYAIVSLETMGGKLVLGGGDYRTARTEITEQGFDNTNFINILEPGSSLYEANLYNRLDYSDPGAWFGNLYDAVLYIGTRDGLGR